MRITDENRAQNYIKKHRNKKRWLAFALCLSLFTGTVTLYLLNKPATAMTEDGAQKVGLVLETADSDYEMGLIEQMKTKESDAQADKAVENSSDGVTTVDVTQLGDGDPDKSDTSKTWEEIVEVIPEDETGANADKANSASSGEASDASSNASSEDKSNASGNASSEDSSNASTSASSLESADAASSASSDKNVKDKVDSLDDIQNVTLTARYVDAEGKEIAEKEVLLQNTEDKKSLDLNKDYKVIENYYYLEAGLDDKKIVSIAEKTGIAQVSDQAGKDSSEDAGAKESSIDDASAYAASDDASDEGTEKAYTYYEATTSEGEVIEIKKDAEITFSYAAANTKESFTYQNDEVTVMVKLSKPGILPDGVELSVKTVDKSTNGYNYSAYIDALNESAEEIAKANGDEAKTTYDENNVVLFDIAFMLKEIEYEPKDGTVSVSISFKNNQISDGLGTTDSEDVSLVHLPVSEEVMKDVNATSDATEISASDISVEVLGDSNVELGENKDTISFEAQAFSMYGAITRSTDETWEGNQTYTAKEIVKWLGDSTYFGVVANHYDGQNNHSEANIAVGSISNIQNYTVGISTKVYQSLDEFIISVEKKVEGSPKVGTFNFAAFSDVKGKNKIAGTEFTIKTDETGTGKYIGNYTDLLKGGQYPRLYIYELDEKGQAVMDGEICGSYTVSYGGDSIEAPADAVGFFADNYVESVGLNGYKAEDIIEKVDGATIYYPTGWNSYVGITYYQNQVYGMKPDGSYGWTNYVRTDYSNSSMPVSVQNMRLAAYTASQKLAYTRSSNGVQVVNIVGTKSNGNLMTDLSTKYFKNEKDPRNYAVNTGFKLDDNTLLVINVDLTGATNYTLDKFTYNGQGTGDWSQAANHVIVNLVQKNYAGDYVPYEGDITANIMSGTLIAPLTNVKLTGSYSGTVIADQVIKTCEIHKMDIRTYLDASAAVTVTNKGCEEIVPFEIKANKYVNDVEPDGNEIFDFTVRYLNPSTNKWYVLANNLHNDGEVIKYSVANPLEELAMHYDNKTDYFFLLTENDTKGNYTKDKTGILAKVKYYPKKDVWGNVTRVIDEINYYRVPEEGVDSMIKSGTIDGTYNSDEYRIKPEKEKSKGKEYGKVAFFNTNSKATMLRIHKMVVNVFGSKVVRDATDGTALLDTVIFRITNNDTGNYIVLDGFIGNKKDHTDTAYAYEYDSKTHKQNGKKYLVTYNQSAQWTIEGLPSGLYSVEEVADGKTFTYNPDTNTSTVLDGEKMCRVTKYDVTIDDEESGVWQYGSGGDNYRKVFSRDLNGKSDFPPTNVKVGGAVQTVQVCNYYSSPIGPIQVTKNFAGSVWSENMAFEFTIAADRSENVHDSEGHEVKIDRDHIPMPEEGNTITVTGKDATYDSKTGNYTAVAQFSSIPYRYEGTYYYTITENNTEIDGVKYDTRTYYVKVVVSKKYTTFTKRYNCDKLTHPIPEHNIGGKFVENGQTVVTEDFFYLGADVIYAADADFQNVVAECELYLLKDPDTEKPDQLEFKIDYTKGSGADVAFNNTMEGRLTVNKVWIDSDGQINQSGHSPLTLQIWQRTVKASGKKSSWKIYEGTSIQLSDENGWTQTIENLPLMDKNGETYEYCVKEPDEYLFTYEVSYSYSSSDQSVKGTYDGNSQKQIKVSKTKVKDTGYSMITNGGIDYGSVTITNKTTYANELPSTGGSGTMPFTAAGFGLILFAFVGMLFLGKRNRA